MRLRIYDQPKVGFRENQSLHRPENQRNKNNATKILFKAILLFSLQRLH